MISGCMLCIHRVIGVIHGRLPFYLRCEIESEFSFTPAGTKTRSRQVRAPSEATPGKRDTFFDFISHNPKVLFSRELRPQLGIIVRIRRRPNARKRHQNKHLGF
jgi:hypothetical protein